MSSLISIARAPDIRDVTAHHVHSMPVLVIFPHNQCNCRCVMCDIWRIRESQEITPGVLESHLGELKQLGVKWVVFSGGEPQLNEQWSSLAQMLRSAGIRVTLLTAGLLLKTHAQAIIENVNDVIVSLDGPLPVHNRVRRVANAFEQMSEGVSALRHIRPDFEIRGRCTVQRENRRSLSAVVHAAKEIGLNSISFLAADVSSSAFNHPVGWTPDQSKRIALSAEELNELETEIEALIHEHRADLESGFVLESPDKLRRIVKHFRSHLHQASNTPPRCNAPWVSAVIEASGDVRPCFFHPVVGNIHRQSLPDVVNGPEALHFRAALNVAENAICRNCVCSLYIPPANELAVPPSPATS